MTQFHFQGCQPVERYRAIMALLLQIFFHLDNFSISWSVKAFTNDTISLSRLSASGAIQGHHGPLVANIFHLDNFSISWSVKAFTNDTISFSRLSASGAIQGHHGPLVANIFSFGQFQHFMVCESFYK